MITAPRLLLLAAGAIILSSRSFARYPDDWLLENIAVAVGLITLWWCRRWFSLSTSSYVLLLVFLWVHEYGAVYSYVYTPPGEWLRPLLAADRNHYDRVVHLASGLFLVHPLCEIFSQVIGRPTRWALLFAIQAVMLFGALYEISEWLVASMVNPGLGAEFVGVQDDAWDATKDLGCALLGAIVAVAAEVAVSRNLRR